MEGALDQETRAFVVFRLGAEEYALPIERVQSIIRYEEATPVPRTPRAVQGVINMRGNVIPVLDLSQRLRGKDFVPSATSRIVVAEGAGGTVGLAVDAANEVANIPAAQIKPAPESILSVDTAGAIGGVADRDGNLVIILDLDEAVPKAEYEHTVNQGAGQEGEPDV